MTSPSSHPLVLHYLPHVQISQVLSLLWHPYLPVTVSGLRPSMFSSGPPPCYSLGWQRHLKGALRHSTPEPICFLCVLSTAVTAGQDQQQWNYGGRCWYFSAWSCLISVKSRSYLRPPCGSSGLSRREVPNVSLMVHVPRALDCPLYLSSKGRINSYWARCSQLPALLTVCGV
jgi:hypothetical protein